MRKYTFPVAMVMVFLALSGCGPQPVEEALPTRTPTVTLPPPTATPLPPRSLTVCVGAEPATLYPYGNVSATARTILSVVYPGPLATNSYTYQPVILEQLPSLENGDVQIVPAKVYVGDEVIDAEGNPVTLTKGVRLSPAGCRRASCAIEYDGAGEIEMDQMQVTFRLRPGLRWSDGEPLTAADSVYSFQLNAADATPGPKYLVERTQSYEAADEQTVQWWGKPGYVGADYLRMFWAPYPQHLWSQHTAEELPEFDLAARTPVGWGPFLIQEWVAGDHLTMVRNPYYFRASEGLPRLDQLVFRFYADADAAVNALVDGRCDVLDTSLALEGQVSRLRAAATEGRAQLFAVPSNVMERLDFGIRPASYDNGYQANADRPDLLSDPRLRQAIALCLDRQKVVNEVLFGLSVVPDSFLPREHPFYNNSVARYAFNPTAARTLLEEAGWRDLDANPATPLQAFAVPNVPAGTPLILNYYTTNAVQRVQVAGILKDSLAQCGIQVNVQYLTAEELYAPGPQGPLFGRNFDLAEYALGVLGMDPLCEWYTTAEIPTATNHWIGVNISGYSNPAFDAACRTVRESLPEEAAYATAYRELQAIFAEDLPVVPLYWRVRVAATRPDLCHFALDATAQSALWNVESLDYGEGCP